MARKTRNPLHTRRVWSPNVLITIAIVVVAVVVIGGALLVSHTDDTNASRGSGEVAQELRADPDRNTIVEAGGKVTVVEFLDYQCPACAAYYRNVTRPREQDYADRITFVTRNFPLEVHPLARQAARAAESAAKQGHYAQMYHALYDNYPAWALTAGGDQVSDDAQRAAGLFDEFATQLHLDLDRFHTDMKSSDVQQRIAADLAAGNKVGVQSTPTIFVNGKRFEPAGNEFSDVSQQLRSMIDEALG